MQTALTWWNGRDAREQRLLGVLGIIVLVRLLGRSSASAPMQPGAAPETALEILKRRYASGEIGKAEFEEKKRDLT